jgi:hypothetical protein
MMNMSQTGKGSLDEFVGKKYQNFDSNSYKISETNKAGDAYHDTFKLLRKIYMQLLDHIEQALFSNESYLPGNKYSGIENLMSKYFAPGNCNPANVAGSYGGSKSVASPGYKGSADYSSKAA